MSGISDDVPASAKWWPGIPRPDDTPSPEDRAEQRKAWKQALSKAAAAARTSRVKRKPPATKAGMHRKAK